MYFTYFILYPYSVHNAFCLKEYWNAEIKSCIKFSISKIRIWNETISDYILIPRILGYVHTKSVTKCVFTSPIHHYSTGHDVLCRIPTNLEKARNILPAGEWREWFREGKEWRQMLSEFLIMWHMCAHKLRCECLWWWWWWGTRKRKINCNPISYRGTCKQKGLLFCLLLCRRYWACLHMAFH